MNINKDLLGLNKKPDREILTPHRLIVAILINEFFKLREDGNAILGISKKHVRDFSILLLKLMQSPDLTLLELQSVLSCGIYSIHKSLVSNFNTTLDQLNTMGTSYLLNLIDGLGKLIATDLDGVIMNKSCPQINKSSVTGYYLRRLLLNFDKLTFSEVTAVLAAFQRYYTPAENAQERTGAKRKLELFSTKDWYLNKDQWSRRQAELFIASQAALLNGNDDKAFNPKELHMHVKNLLKTNPDLAEAHFLNYLNYLRVREYCGAVRSLYHCFDRIGLVDLKGNVDEKSKGFQFAALNLAILHFHFGHRDEALAALKEAIMLAQETNDNMCLQHALSWLYCLTTTNKDKLLEHSILKSLDLNLTYIVSLGIQSFVQYAGVSGGTPKHIFETITRSDIVNFQHAYGDLICTSFAQKAAMWLFYGKIEMASLWSQLSLHLNSDNNSLGKTYFGEALCQAMCNVSNHLLLHGEYMKAYAILHLAKERFPNEPISHVWLLAECIFTFVRALRREEWTEAEAAAQKMGVYDIWESQLRMSELLLMKRDFAGAYKCVSDLLDSRKETNVVLRIDYHVRGMILLAETQYISSYPNVVPPPVLNVCLAYVNDFHVDYLGSIVYLHLANIQLLMNMSAQALKVLDGALIDILTHGGNYDRARGMMLYVKCIVANARHENTEEREKILFNAAEMLYKVREDFMKVEAYSRTRDAIYLQERNSLTGCKIETMHNGSVLAHFSCELDARSVDVKNASTNLVLDVYSCVLTHMHNLHFAIGQTQLYNEIDFTEKRNKCALDFRLLEEDHPSKHNTSFITFV